MTAEREVTAAGWRNVSPTEVLRVGAALGAILWVDLLLRLFGYRRTQRLVAQLVPMGAASADGLPAGARCRAVVLAVDRACRAYRPGAMCLRRSLVLWAWLRRRGVQAHVQLGVRRDGDDALVGHAWVEWRGAAVFEPSDAVDNYVTFASDRGLAGTDR